MMNDVLSAELINRKMNEGINERHRKAIITKHFPIFRDALLMK